MKTLAAGFNSTANVIPTSAEYSWVDRRFSPLAFVQEATHMITTRSATAPDITELYVQFLAILPTIKQYAELAHRHVANFHDREDAIAETIALTWAWYHTMARLEDYMGIDMTTLAVVATRYVRAGSLLCSQDRDKGNWVEVPHVACGRVVKIP